MTIFMQQYTNQYLKEIIYSTILATGMNIELKQDYTGVNMSYNFITHIVSFDANRLVEAAAEFSNIIPLEIYINALTLHELGHAIDRPALQASLPRTIDFFEMRNENSLNEIYNTPSLLSMIIEEHIMNIAFEETAWVNAKILNNKLQLVNTDTFEKIKNHSLSSYLNNYREDLALFKEIQDEAELLPA